MVAFPLLLIPLAVYNIIIVMMPGLQMTQPVVSVPLKSGALWSITSGDILIALAAIFLMLELVKAARPGGKTLVEIFLSILLCGAAIAEFVLYTPFATSVFLLAVISAVDVLGSIAISAQSRRRRVVREAAAVETRETSRYARREPTIVEPEPDNMQYEAIPQDNLHGDAHANQPGDVRRSPYSPDGVTVR